MEQTMVRVRGRMLSWVDFGGVGPTVLALHGSFGHGAVFAPIAGRLREAARVTDAAAVIDRLGSDPVVVLGHSLGGITAYQLAARHPELVRALIIEDVGAVRHHGLGDWWSDWLGSTCPALLLHGQRSTLLSTEMAHQMVRRRSRTQLVEFPDAGHWIHDDDPAGCTAAILDFLSKISGAGPLACVGTSPD